MDWGKAQASASIAVPPQDDTTTYSVRSWITLDKNHLGAGDAQQLNVTLTVPSNTPSGERYAAIYMHSQSDNLGSSSIISGIIIPVIITVNSSVFSPNISGQIGDLAVPQSYSGKAIRVLTTFNNTGKLPDHQCREPGNDQRQLAKISSGKTKLRSQRHRYYPISPRIIDTRYNIGWRQAITLLLRILHWPTARFIQRLLTLPSLNLLLCPLCPYYRALVV